MAVGDPELVALLALAGCGLALLGMALSATHRRRPTVRNALATRLVDCHVR